MISTYKRRINAKTVIYFSGLEAIFQYANP